MKNKNLIKIERDDGCDYILSDVNKVLRQYGLEIVDLEQDEYDSVDDECSLFYKLVEIEGK